MDSSPSCILKREGFVALYAGMMLAVSVRSEMGEEYRGLRFVMRVWGTPPFYAANYFGGSVLLYLGIGQHSRIVAKHVE